MHLTTATIITALGLVNVAAAAPTPDDGCLSYPWFIVPYPDSAYCTGIPATFQPTSGPYDPNAGSIGCRSLSDPRAQPISFQSVSVNRDACPQQKWEIRLYTDAGCTTKPFVVQTNACVPSPGTDAAGRWSSFEAYLLQP